MDSEHEGTSEEVSFVDMDMNMEFLDSCDDKERLIGNGQTVLSYGKFTDTDIQAECSEVPQNSQKEEEECKIQEVGGFVRCKLRGSYKLSKSQKIIKFWKAKQCRSPGGGNKSLIKSLRGLMVKLSTLRINTHNKKYRKLTQSKKLDISAVEY